MDDDAISVESAEILYATVGHVMVLAAALDSQLNRILVRLLGLVDSPMLAPAIAAIETRRKIEIAKEYSKKIRPNPWRTAIAKHMEGLEKFNRARNVAAHSEMVFDGLEAVLTPSELGKILKVMHVPSKTFNRMKAAYFDKPLADGVSLLGSGENLVENLERFRARATATQRRI